MKSLVALLAGTLAALVPAAPSRGATLWIPAGAARETTPLMVDAARLGPAEEGAMGAVLLPMVTEWEAKPETDCWAEYSVRIATPGLYRLWCRVRFPAGPDDALRVVPSAAVLGAGVRIVGGGDDARRWHWAPAGEFRLPAGEWFFRVYPHRVSASAFGPLRWRQAVLTQVPRLNAFCLSDDDAFTPSDAAAQAALGAPAPPPPAPRVEPARLPAPVSGEPPVAGRRSVPDWMRCPRWFTKDSWREELPTRRAGDIALLVRQLAANGGETLRLSVFWGGEAYYASDVAPRAPGLGSLDYLREATDEAAKAGAKIVVYMNPNAMYAGHPLSPECLVRLPDGSPRTNGVYGANFRGAVPAACVNHPRYRAFLRDVLTEMFTRYRPDGLYVDGLTPHACFCGHCRAKWRAMFGTDMPVEKLGASPPAWAVWSEFGRDPQPVGDVENDPDARRWTEMMARTLDEVTREFSETVKRARPDAVTLFHSHPKPGNEDAYDGTLTEVYSPRPWVHTAWRSGELAGYSAVYRVPVLFNVYPHQHYTEAEARYHALQGLAAGAYPNFWNAAGMRPVFDFMRRNAGALDFRTTAPVSFLALPRDLRESDTQRKTPPAANVSYAPRDRFLAPCVGAYSALMRAGLPVVTLHRPHFEEDLAGFRVLVLANVALMSDAQAEAVRRFVRGGGGLIATHETSLYDEKGRRREDFALADVFGAHYRTTLAAGPRAARLEAGAEWLRGLAAADLAHTGEPLVAAGPAGAETAAWLGDAPGVLDHPFGRGRAILLPGRYDSMQCYEPSAAIEGLLARCVRRVAPDGLPVEIEADGPIAVSLFRQPGRLIVHLVNHRRDSRLRSDACTPIEPVTLRVRLPEGVHARIVRRLWEDREVPFRTCDGVATIDVGRLDEYEAIRIE